MKYALQGGVLAICFKTGWSLETAAVLAAGCGSHVAVLEVDYRRSMRSWAS
jgi:hypothetical protein